MMAASIYIVAASPQKRLVLPRWRDQRLGHIVVDVSVPFKKAEERLG